MKTMQQFFACLAACLLIVSVAGSPVFASTSATITGRVTDQQGLVVPGAQVQATNILTNISYAGETNEDGLYRISNLPPGEYRVIVQKQGFASIAKPGVELHVQDAITLNFSMQVGSITQTVTVEAGAPLINTESAAVSTVVDRHFVENLPLNGRSFQTLIQLTPGVVFTPASFTSPGQFSVNGQRASANQFMVDGVAANISVSPVAGLSQTAGGALPGVSILGGTNNLVSVDAMQEFRIQTSSYAPEFGRTPGAQISIATRSGTNEFHGTLFEYFRNDVLDANDWFANQSGLPKPKERQNDFGGVLSGPIIRNRTFFFVSYEGQRLRLPRTGLTTVPSQSARQSASATIRPYLDAYPLPNGADLGNGQAEFNATFSDEAKLDATSVRIDHRLRDKVNLFGRYSHAPSDLVQRGGSGGFASLNSISRSRIKTQTLTLGTNWLVLANLNNEFRFNYSHNSGSNRVKLDTFGGAVVPPDSILFPSPFSSAESQYTFAVFSLQGGSWTLGKNASNIQRQINVIDNISLQKGTHSLKFGVDYRQLSPKFGPQDYLLNPGFLDVPSLIAGSPFFVFVTQGRGGTAAFHDFGVYAQDTWRVHTRVILTYGLRWEFEPPPSASNGPDFFAVNGIDDLSNLALAPPGTSLWETRFGNFAPRVGVAYQLSQAKDFETVVRGGFGVFYDLAVQQIGDAFLLGNLPFSVSKFCSAFFSDPGCPSGTLTFPLSPGVTQPPPFSPLPSPLSITASDPALKLPYVLQWNIAFEQALGNSQAISLSYVAAVGRRLVMTESLFLPSPSFSVVQLARNGATSDYHALQIQFRRPLARGLQTLASYTWSHSIDEGSSSASGTGNSLFNRAFGPATNRGPSDFDIRQVFAAAVTYDFPAPPDNSPVRTLLGGWSIDNIIQAQTATPVNVFDSRIRFSGTFVNTRPDVVQGVPLHTQDASLPGGRRINAAAFQSPPLDPLTGFPTRPGTLGRNALRGFGAVQWNFAVRRQFSFSEQLQLQFRAEFFNLLNHPNFANPVGDLASPLFGQSTQMLGRTLAGSDAGVGFASLYQVGGPRSIQLALKLQF